MKKRTIYITLFIIFIIGVISLIGTFAIDSSITEGNSTKADYLFNITLGDRTNRDIVIPSYDSKIVDIKISNPNEFNMSYLLYLEGVNSNISIINISNNEASGVLNSKTNTLIKVFIQNNSSSDITTSIKDIVGFEKEKLSVPNNNTSINKGTYYKVIVKSNENTYGKVKPNIKLSTSKGTVKYTLVPNTGYQYKSTTCNGTIVDDTLTISNITGNTTCEVVFEPKELIVSFDLAGGEIELASYTKPKEYTYTVPYTGEYKLEVWGAQGGTYNSTYRGGFGGYSTGVVSLTAGDDLYINVGGQGSFTFNATGILTVSGGRNGGGKGTSGGDGEYSAGGGSGGGASHIATVSGTLSTLSSSKEKILIVASGGGGASVDSYSSYRFSYSGANGGGVSGNKASGQSTTCTAGDQTSGSAFGAGGNYASYTHGAAGGGGGYYGGTGGGANAPGCGGSGYIGNSLLTDKYMYCYNCTTSDDIDTKTYTISKTSSTPTSDYAKSGDGAAKIVLLSFSSNTLSYGEKYSNLPVPQKNGSTFEGWYTKPNGKGEKITDDTLITNRVSHTLYAYWKQPTEYTKPGSYTYIIQRTGFYKLELWGAQGGTYNSTYRGGYGGYSTGTLFLEEGTILYLNVGGKGSFLLKTASTSTVVGGYNGGGNGTGGGDGENSAGGGSGGGATHVATASGLLLSLSSSKEKILIVAGGGGGAGVDSYSSYRFSYSGANGGGISGNKASGQSTTCTAGDQTSGNAFGAGGNYASYTHGAAGGGGGYYGGTGGGANAPGCGGSGYIGNSLLTDKYMYCYNCATSDDVDTKTYTTTKYSSTPTSDYAKSGDGAIKITFIEMDEVPPTGTMSTSIDHSTINVSIDAADNRGIDHYEYYLSTGSTCPSDGYITSDSNTYSFVVKQTGTYYVCAKVVDGNDNALSLVSDTINISKIYSITIRYNVNGGTITPNTGSNIWTIDDTGLIYKNNIIFEQTLYYGEPADLVDYNNSDYINIDPGDLHVLNGGEWMCLSGCSTDGKIFDQTVEYTTNDFCDVTDSNCIIVLGLRLVSDIIPPTCTLSASGSNITAKATDDTGIFYQGWNSSYSGTNSTSISISAGTHTYYVKDTTGNTNTCSISIVEKNTPKTLDATAHYKTVYSGSCTCSEKVSGGTSYVDGYCDPSSGCSCISGTTISTNNCIGESKLSYYTCPENTILSNSTCIYYVCSDGYSEVSGNNYYCYKK